MYSSRQTNTSVTGQNPRHNLRVLHMILHDLFLDGQCKPSIQYALLDQNASVLLQATPGRSISKVGSQTLQEHSRPLQARYRTLQAAPGGIIPGSWCPNEPGLVPRRPEHPPKTLQCRHKPINNCVSLRTCAISCFVMLSARSDGSKGELPPAEICHCP